MAIDRAGNTIKEGDTILFHGLSMTITKVMESGLIGASNLSIEGNQVNAQGMVVPGNLICILGIGFISSQPVDCYVIKTPQEDKKQVQ